MDVVAYGAVLASAAAHAYWNLVLKRSGGGHAFVGLSKLLEVVVLAPAFAWWALPDAGALAAAWPVVLVGAVLTLANYAALARAYQAGDLALAYPVARGGTLLFLPAFGFVAFGERPSALGWAAFGCILGGIAVLPRRAAPASGRGARGRTVAYALLAALAAAGYTVWDKHAVQTLPALAYFYAYTTLVAAAYVAFVARRFGGAALRAEWRARRWELFQVAVCNTVAYLLVLVALRTGTTTYVVALRQLGVAIGAVLGWRLLGEAFGAPQRLGVALIVAGSVLVALAR